MIFALICIIGLFGITTRGIIFRPLNISNVFMQNSYVIFLAIGMFFCILTGNVDLSVGSVVAVAGALVGYMIVKLGMPTYLAVIITIAAGIGIGVFQGSFIAFLNVPPFIVTLAGMLIFRGLTMVILQGQSLSPFSRNFQYFASGFVLPNSKIMGINTICLAVFIVSVIGLVAFEVKKRNSRTKYGFDVPHVSVTILKLAAIIVAMGTILMRYQHTKACLSFS